MKKPLSPRLISFGLVAVGALALNVASAQTALPAWLQQILQPAPTPKPAAVGPRAVTFVVNDTGDAVDVANTDGVCDSNLTTFGLQCTLRAAIQQANATAGADVINFALTGGTTITPATVLPSITESVIIDGTTQAGYTNAPLIEINGTTATASDSLAVNGLNVLGSGSTVKALIINRYSGAAILLSGTGGHSVFGNYLGTNVAGSAAQGNSVGVFVDSANNTIGAITTPAALGRNVISGNTNTGVLIRGVSGNTVLSNYIGTSATGVADLGNALSGVLLDSGATSTNIGTGVVGSGNVISGNAGGIRLENASTQRNTIASNIIGLAANGNTVLPNDAAGIQVVAATLNTIGTTGNGRNTISGNSGPGVSIDGGATGNSVQFNRIGTDAAGEFARPNTGPGVIISNSATTTVASNTISGNGGSGVEITTFGGATATGNLIQSNNIGSLAGNTGDGVTIGAGVANNTVGGSALGNFITNNGAAGIRVAATAGTGNRLSQNSITENGGQGIDLGASGVTANDSGDPDTGGNNTQNFPVLSNLRASGTDTLVDVTLDSAAGNYVIEFFANTAPDASGNGEGEQFIQTETLAFPVGTPRTVTLPGNQLGQFVSATARRATAPFDTSEFSAVVRGPKTFTVNSTATDNDGSCDAVGVGDCTLLEAITATNAGPGGDTIGFNIAGTGVQTIAFGSTLPDITKAVTINGFTQPLSTPNTRNINLSVDARPLIQLTGSGLTINASNTNLNGLIINGTFGGVTIESGANNCTITGCFIGTNERGENPGTGQSVGDGVEISSTGNTIGGLTPASRNVITGGNGDAIWLNTGGNSNTIQGNFLMVNALGTITTDANGGGVRVNSNNNLIGGTVAEARNVMSAGNGSGVTIIAGTGNRILRNSMGTNPAGTAGLPEPTATGGQPNNSGITVLDGTNNQIGDGTADNGNLIAFNVNYGIVVADTTLGGVNTNPTGVRIRGNSIHSNGGLGIDLAPRSSAFNVPTPNDETTAPFDSDTGPNRLQNKPTLTAIAGNNIIGNLKSTPNTNFGFDFYTSPAADPSGFGEGTTLLYSQDLRTDASGNISFSLGISTPFTGFVTATATNLTTGDTSEFSNAVTRASASLVVDTTSDANLDACTTAAGDCSLRGAITKANTTAGADTISFAIPGTGVQTIAATSALPIITEAVTIDGPTTGPAAPTILINGAGAGAGVHGLRVNTSNVIIRDLAIGGFTGTGIRLESGSGHAIEACYVGVDPNGTTRRANGVGIQLLGPTTASTIGGSTAAARNIVSGNTGAGVIISSGANTNTVRGNYIGITATGAAALSNGGQGVLVNSFGDTIAGNVISGNTATGLHIVGDGTAATATITVQANIIGLNATGTAKVANRTGMEINSRDNVTVGGLATNLRNTVSGNTTEGISILNSIAGNDGITIQGNFIGSNSAGSTGLGNGGRGIFVGGTGDQILSNSIAGNGNNGIELFNATGVLIQQNNIGSTANGNLGSGVFLSNGAKNNFIGGTATDTYTAAQAKGNFIAGNRTGVSVFSGANDATGNSIRGNTIEANTALGININGNGVSGDAVTTNDLNDPDTGNNNGQNFPVITSATALRGDTVISGTLNSVAASTYVIDLYSNAAADPSGFGEGSTGLGSVSVITGAGVNTVPFTLTVTGSLAGRSISATATRVATGDTSEFSRALAAGAVIGIPTVTSFTPASGPRGTIVTLTGTNFTGATAVSFNGINTTLFTVNSPTQITATVPAGASSGLVRVTTPGGTSASATGFTVTAGYVVTNINNTNAGSLREALTFANTTTGLNITFGIPGAGIKTITPLSPLPIVSRPLTIDGYTQPTSAVNTVATGGAKNTQLRIELNGASAGATATGLHLTGGISTVRGLAINRFGLDGLVLETNGGNTVEGNYIGTNPTGTLDLGNGGNGITILSPSNNIGGATAGAGNVISGNTGAGVLITGLNNDNSQVLGNYIGINAAGTAALANGRGVIISDQARLNTVGGTAVAARNIIAGCEFGVLIAGTGTRDNLVQGNYIGTNATGTAAIANEYGVGISDGASANTIGGNATTPGQPPANLISGNTNNGILITGAAGNTVQGNYLGTNLAGIASFGNFTTTSGISIADASTGNTIGGTIIGQRNIIAGHAGHGILIQGAGTRANQIRGNLIGINAAGLGVGNGSYGVLITDQASANTIGGLPATPGVAPGNVVSGNGNTGIQIFGVGTNSNVVQGNLVGTNLTGTAARPNAVGVSIQIGARGNVIGGAATARNIISGNQTDGVVIAGAGTGANQVLSNYIGTNLTGTAALGNLGNGVSFDTGASGNVLGDTSRGNRIAFNGGDGVRAAGATNSNRVRFNDIFSNTKLGINLVGGTETAAGVTANDAGDADAGPNNLQNYPALTSVSQVANVITINSTFNSVPANTYTLDIYANAVADGSGFGEGQTYLGSVSAPGNNVAARTLAVPGSLVGQFISVTATDAAGNTSEFSRAVVVTGAVAQTVTLTVAPSTFNEGAGPAAATGTVRRSVVSAAPLVVNLSSSDATEATVPATVTIAANQPTATFAVAAVNDLLVDGSQIVDITASGAGFTTSTFRLTVTDNDTEEIGLFAWGYNQYGQIGDGTTTQRPLAVRVPLANVAIFDGGGSHSLAVLTDGTVRAWGYNGAGQLGDTTLVNRAAPITVTGAGGIGSLTGVATAPGSIAAGWYHSLAVKTDGTVWAWGFNDKGQLGNGSNATSRAPVQVRGPGGVGFLTNVVAVTAGVDHSLALRADGTVWAWGNNNKGQLGDATTTNRTFPVQVLDTTGSGNLTAIASLSAGASHSVAVTTGGTVFAWGSNLYGQLGNGRPEDSFLPRAVSGLPAISSIAAGNVHTLARTSAGGVWSWGNNFFGQLGDSTKVDRRTPVQVRNLPTTTAIAAGDGFSLALRNDRLVASWGHDLFGSLGDGASGEGTDKSTAVLVSGVTNTTAIAGGYGHGLALGRRIVTR